VAGHVRSAGLEGQVDESRPVRPWKMSDDRVEDMIVRALESPPSDGLDPLERAPVLCVHEAHEFCPIPVDHDHRHPRDLRPTNCRIRTPVAMIRTFFILVALMCAIGTAAAVLSGPAAASPSVSQVIVDCNSHGKLTGHYSAALLRTALRTMPADVTEYTNCYDIIQSALLAQVSSSDNAGRRGSRSGSSGAFLPTPLIVVLVLLVLAAAGFGAVAIRRRGSSASTSIGE
jgi:hypothetical protein